MPVLLAAADVLVDSTVGVTSLEALTAGCRVVAFGAPPGHSRENAAALVALGLAEAPRNRRELTEALARLDGAPATATSLPPKEDPVELIVSAPLRVRARVRRRRPAVVAAAAALLALVMTGWTVASPMPYPVVARTFDLDGVTHVGSGSHEVGLIIESSPAQRPRVERLMAAAGVRASFAVDAPPLRREIRTVSAQGDRLLPALARGGAVGALHAGGRLRRVARALGLRGRFYYLRPTSGYTLADYLAGRAVGALPVSATRWDSENPPALRPGDIVVVDLRRTAGVQSLTALIRLLSRSRLRPVPLDEPVDSVSVRTTGSERASASAPPPVRSSASSSSSSRHADAGHHSWASSGASATGTNVVNAKTRGAT
jgi:hypothetical protein